MRDLILVASIKMTDPHLGKSNSKFWLISHALQCKVLK